MQGILLGILIVLILTAAWVILYDTTHFEVTVYRISNPKIKKAFKAVVLSDLHNKKYGRDNELLTGQIDELEPDLVLAAGDLLNAKPGAQLETALQLVEKLAAKYPFCYGVGNHEHRLKVYPEVYGDMAKRYEEGLAACKVSQMENERRSLQEYGVCVVGSQIAPRYYKRLKLQSMEETYLEETLGKASEEEYNILLAHNPDYFPEYAAWGADLVLAGHVHGGVARIPFWNKGVISPAIRLFPKYDGGLFQRENSAMIVSRGLGVHTIPVRFWNPAELILLEFVPGEKSAVEKIALKKTENMIK